MNKTKSIDPKAIARAKRTRSARKFAGLTMEQLNIQHNIPPSTLQGWENTGALSLKNRSLTLKGAERLVKALQKEGVSCSVQWLMEGTGIGPHFVHTQQAKPKKKQHNLWGVHLSLQHEINAFEKNNPDAIVIRVTDDSLTPFYEKGDIVAGNKHYLNDIDKCINRICIIETLNKDIVIRKLHRSKKSQQYSLMPVQEENLQACLRDITLYWVAPIIWHRKPD